MRITWGDHVTSTAFVNRFRQPSDISHAMVAGRLLMRDGELLTLDEERIMYEAEKRAWRMVGAELHTVREYQV